MPNGNKKNRSKPVGMRKTRSQSDGSENELVELSNGKQTQSRKGEVNKRKSGEANTDAVEPKTRREMNSSIRRSKWWCLKSIK